MTGHRTMHDRPPKIGAMGWSQNLVPQQIGLPCFVRHADRNPASAGVIASNCSGG
jgi:hypothetical protein